MIEPTSFSHGVRDDHAIVPDLGQVDPFGNVRIGFEGSTTINRKDFGVTWNAVLETGGVLVGEKIVLEFEISAIKQA
jgi:polyisoprenoid-binding protein YceI